MFGAQAHERMLQVNAHTSLKLWLQSLQRRSG
jgi:hypothetical protein